MSGLLPSVASRTFQEKVIHIDESMYNPGPDAILKSTVTDSGASPTTTIRKGNSIVKKTSDGLFYLDDGPANASSADRNTVAAVVAQETADGDWASKTISVYVNGSLLVTVTLGGGDDTDAEVVTALNGNAIFAANCIASASGSRVHIKTLKAGADQYLYVTSNLSTAFGSSGQTGSGTDAEYYITEEEVSMLDPDTGAVADRPVKTSFAAYYDESELLNLSAEARATLSRRGARFG